jgi:hypothetical protein
MMVLISAVDCAVRCQVAHLIGHHGEASTLLAGPRRFDGGIQRQQLVCSAMLWMTASTSPIRPLSLQAMDDFGGAGDFITDIVDALDHAEHGLLTLLGGSFGIIGGACRLRGVAGDFPGRGGHFFHGRGDLIGA